MESLASRGIGAGAVPCETKDDGQEVDVGDIQLAPAYTFRGQIVLEDGKPVPPDMHVTLAADRGWDSQIAPISPDGRFEFHGLPADIYNLMPAVKGYHLPEGSNPSRDRKPGRGQFCDRDGTPAGPESSIVERLLASPQRVRRAPSLHSSKAARALRFAGDIPRGCYAEDDHAVNEDPQPLRFPGNH